RPDPTLLSGIERPLPEGFAVLHPTVAWAAFGLAALVFSASLLAVAKPPTHTLWKLSILVIEAGHLLAPLCLLPAPVVFFAGGPGKAAAVLFLVSACLLITPLARAQAASARLLESYSASVGRGMGPRDLGRPRPIVRQELFSGVPAASAAPKPMVYARLEGRELKLDYYAPAKASLGTTGRAPCVVVVHGGGWDSGDRGQMAPLNAYLASAGYAVASLDYRLAPGHVYPAPVEDVVSALDFLRAGADDLGIDPARFALLGRSAGGQIALQAAYFPSRAPAVRGVIAFYAPADMVFGYSLPTSPLIMDSRKVMEQYLGSSYPEHPEKYTASSPLAQVGENSPPTLLLHGRRDVLVSFRHTEHLRARLAELGVKHFVVDLPWAAHGFDYVFRGPGSQIGLYFIERFLAEVMDGNAGPGFKRP